MGKLARTFLSLPPACWYCSECITHYHPYPPSSWHGYHFYLRLFLIMCLTLSSVIKLSSNSHPYLFYSCTFISLNRGNHPDLFCFVITLSLYIFLPSPFHPPSHNLSSMAFPFLFFSLPFYPSMCLMESDNCTSLCNIRLTQELSWWL